MDVFLTLFLGVCSFIVANPEAWRYILFCISLFLKPLKASSSLRRTDSRILVSVLLAGWLCIPRTVCWPPISLHVPGVKLASLILTNQSTCLSGGRDVDIWFLPCNSAVSIRALCWPFSMCQNSDNSPRLIKISLITSLYARSSLLSGPWTRDAFCPQI